MKEKNEIDVLIAGNKYTLCGYESSDYLQRIASYINGKYDEMRKATGNTLMDRERKNVFVQLNIADD